MTLNNSDTWHSARWDKIDDAGLFDVTVVYKGDGDIPLFHAFFIRMCELAISDFKSRTRLFHAAQVPTSNQLSSKTGY